MNLTKSFFALFLSCSLVLVSFLSFTVQSISAQDTNNALRRGYRTGYSDGYMSGYRDSIENATKSYEKHDEYARANRAYNKDYGTLEDYRNGYQQGFESGYDTGFEKRSFDATVPVNLSKRGIVASKIVVETPTTKTTIEEKSPEKPAVETAVAATPVETVVAATPVETVVAATPVETAVTTQVETAVTTQVEPQVSENTTSAPPTDNAQSTQAPVIIAKTENINFSPSRTDTLVIPVETELIIELLDDVNTERNKEGDKFQARIVSPNEVGGAIIEGKISKIQKPGRIKRRAEVVLSFDRIVLGENRWSNFNAILTEVLPVKGDNVKRVDTEGTIEGKSSVKSDSVKVGAATGTGLVIGAAAGGPVGAAVGAGVGAAFGVGGIFIERGRHIRLGKNQQLRIKTVYETQIR
ncbi:MAG TPA: hypothetical protein VNI60_00930 [Pyrinomonadaceae bacterium]|nr:hypothetical protein [Pyrinomonadaceae bacterium]